MFDSDMFDSAMFEVGVDRGEMLRCRRRRRRSFNDYGEWRGSK